MKKNGFLMGPPYSFNEALGWIHRAASEGIQQFEWENRKATGEVFWEYVTLRLVIINGAEWILSTAIDITERKQNEEKLRKAYNEKSFFMRELNHRVDRGNANVNFLYRTEHPSALRMLKRISGISLCSEKPVTICGEIASDPKIVQLLFGLGFSNLSIDAHAVNAVRRAVPFL